jgi:hypothetical protein
MSGRARRRQVVGTTDLNKVDLMPRMDDYSVDCNDLGYGRVGQRSAVVVLSHHQGLLSCPEGATGANFGSQCRSTPSHSP